MKNEDGGDGLEAEHFRKMFIGGLSGNTTDETLKDFYSQWGEILDCIVMRDPATKRSRGFGFVTFQKQCEVDAAMAARPHIIDEKTVDPKRAVPRDQSSRSEANVSSKRLYVSGVREEHTEEMFNEYFEQFGKVMKVEIIADKNTGKPRGFAFITFDDYDPVDRCVLQKSHQINFFRCDVKKALSKEEMARAQQMDRERAERMGRSRGMVRPDRFSGPGMGGYGAGWGGPGWGRGGDADSEWGAQGAWNGALSSSNGWEAGGGAQGPWQNGGGQAWVGGPAGAGQPGWTGRSF